MTSVRNRHGQRGFRHAVDGSERLGVEAEAGSGVGEICHGVRVDGFGAVPHVAHRTQVDGAVGGLAQPSRQQRVREVRCSGDGSAVFLDQLGPQQRSAQEVQRRDADHLGAVLHRHGEEPDHPHVVKHRQPADHHVVVGLELDPVDHRVRVDVEVAVRDLYGLRQPGGTGGQLLQRDIGFRGRQRVGVGSGAQRLDRHHVDAALDEQRCGGVERGAEDHGARIDHAQDGLGVAGPAGQVGAGRRLVQHGHRRGAHPRRLHRGRDVDGLAGEHPHCVARADPGRREPTGHPPRDHVDLTPRVPHRGVGFAGDQATVRGTRGRVHFVGERAHGVSSALGGGLAPHRVFPRGSAVVNHGRASIRVRARLGWWLPLPNDPR